MTALELHESAISGARGVLSQGKVTSIEFTAAVMDADGLKGVELYLHDGQIQRFAPTDPVDSWLLTEEELRGEPIKPRPCTRHRRNV